MQGRKCLLVLSSFILLSACSGHTPKKADCYDCTQEEQSWKKFSWNSLEGSWRGSLETIANDVNAKKKRTQEDGVEIIFINGKKFLEAKGVTACGAFPAESVVLNGKLWYGDEQKESQEFSYEVFGKQEGDRVSYGRITLNRSNTGATSCEYQKIGRSVGMNRLELPAVNFAERLTPNGRVLASGATPEFEISMEFLNFDPTRAKTQEFAGRKPAAVEEQDKPPLFFRVFKVARNVNGPYSRGEWTGTKEYLYRLWRSN